MIPWWSKYVFRMVVRAAEDVDPYKKTNQTPKDVCPWAFPYIIIKTYSEKG